MKRIGVIIPAITDNLQTELLDGVFKTASAADCDVIVLTTMTNALDFHIQTEIMNGEESVYCLLERAELDGVLLASQYFVKENVRRTISEKIRRAALPCVDLGGSELGFETVSIPQDKAVYELTEHIITKHDCRRLIFLAGHKDNPDSEQRMQGFLRSADKHGCTYEIVYGDFWKARAAELGEELIQRRKELPDAVICASDIMAVSLCDTLRNGGISVPEDIIITGYDGHLSALSHFPAITTVCGGTKELGIRGTEKLLSMLGISPIHNEGSGLHIIFGSSCGCVERFQSYKEAALLVEKNISNEAEASELLDMRIHSDYITKTCSVQDLSDLTATIDETAHSLKGYKSMYWCILPDWDSSPEQPEICKTKPFPKQMLCLIAKDAWKDGRNVGLFHAKDIVPVLAAPHEPMLLFVLPLHASSQVFGYCGLAYENAADFTVSVMLFDMMSSVANGLRILRHKLYAEYLQKKIEEASLYDKMTDMLSKKGLLLFLEKQLPEKNGIMLVTTAKLAATPTSQQKGQLSDTVMQSELLLANAIRLISGRKMQAARLDKRTFAVVFPLAEGTAPEQYTEELMIQLEVLIRKMQEGSAVGFLPEPYYVCGYVTAPPETCISALWDKLNDSKPKGKGFIGISQLKMLRREIHKAPELDWSLAELAKRLNISKSYVQKLYKEHFGISYIDDLLEARIRMAKQLLTTTDLRVNEVAASCGYQNATHFMRQFKEKTGLSPTEYKKKEI